MGQREQDGGSACQGKPRPDLQCLHVALLQHLANLGAKLGQEGRERHTARSKGRGPMVVDARLGLIQHTRFRSSKSRQKPSPISTAL